MFWYFRVQGLGGLRVPDCGFGARPSRFDIGGSGSNEVQPAIM